MVQRMAEHEIAFRRLPPGTAARVDDAARKFTSGTVALVQKRRSLLIAMLELWERQTPLAREPLEATDPQPPKTADISGAFDRSKPRGVAFPTNEGTRALSRYLIRVAKGAVETRRYQAGYSALYTFETKGPMTITGMAKLQGLGPDAARIAFNDLLCAGVVTIDANGIVSRVPLGTVEPHTVDVLTLLRVFGNTSQDKIAEGLGIQPADAHYAIMALADAGKVRAGAGMCAAIGERTNTELRAGIALSRVLGDYGLPWPELAQRTVRAMRVIEVAEATDKAGKLRDAPARSILSMLAKRCAMTVKQTKQAIEDMGKAGLWIAKVTAEYEAAEKKAMSALAKPTKRARKR